MKLNQSKCHFLTSGSVEHLWVKVGNERIWESQQEKLLGMMLDKDLSFEPHLNKLCKKVNQKISALARIAGILPFQKRRILLKTFIESQFSYSSPPVGGMCLISACTVCYPRDYVICIQSKRSVLLCLHDDYIEPIRTLYISLFTLWLCISD